MNSGAIFVTTNTDESEAVEYIQPETAANGLIVVDVAKFRAFVERLQSAELKEVSTKWDKLAGQHLALYDEFGALRVAYERETGKKWVYEDEDTAGEG